MSISARMWLASSVHTRCCVLIVLYFVQGSKQVNGMQPTNHELMQGILKLGNLLEEKLSDVQNRMYQMEETLVDVYDNIAHIKGRYDSIESKIAAIEDRTSDTLSATKDGNVLQEHTLSVMKQVNLTMSQEFQELKVKVEQESLKEPIYEEIIQFHTNTSMILQKKFLTNSSKCLQSNIPIIEENVDKILSLIKNPCLSPWISMGDSGCFLFVGDIRASWDTARTHCQSRGGDLAVFDVKSKRIDMMNYLEHTPSAIKHRSWWLGGNDRSGSWLWVTGAPVTDGWSQLGDEPDDDAGNNTCVYSDSVREYGTDQLLYDYTCSHSFGFICEK